MSADSPAINNPYIGGLPRGCGLVRLMTFLPSPGFCAVQRPYALA